MAYCAICGRQHEPGVGCLDGTGEILGEAGMGSPPETSKEELAQITKGADRWFLKMLLWALIVIFLLFVISSYFSKSH